MQVTSLLSVKACSVNAAYGFDEKAHLAPSGLDHKLPGKVGGRLRLERSDHNTFVQRITWNNLKKKQKGCKPESIYPRATWQKCSHYINSPLELLTEWALLNHGSDLSPNIWFSSKAVRLSLSQEYIHQPDGESNMSQVTLLSVTDVALRQC